MLSVPMHGFIFTLIKELNTFTVTLCTIIKAETFELNFPSLEFYEIGQS